jgi:hypothetical protein
MENTLIATLARLIGMRLRPRARSGKTATIKDLVAIRKALLACIADCDSVSSERLRLKINHTQTPQHLWLLRNDAYQVISQSHSQGTAAERINTLVEHFEGWVDPKHLSRIK